MSLGEAMAKIGEMRQHVPHYYLVLPFMVNGQKGFITLSIYPNSFFSPFDRLLLMKQLVILSTGLSFRKSLIFMINGDFGRFSYSSKED